MSASELIGLLEAGDVTHVLGIPDNDTAPLFDALAAHPRIRLIPVTREGEAFGIAAGLWLGGASPFIVIQNTGLLESGDALRGTALRMGMPLVVLVGCRGYARMQEQGRDPMAGPPSREEVTRAGLDSVALMTEPTLAAWGVPALRLDSVSPEDVFRGACARARADERTVALLLTRPLERA